MTSTVSLRAIFVDTSAWLALANRGDHHHAAAVAFHAGLGRETHRVTTWGVISETYTWLCYRVGYREAERWLVAERALETQGVVEVVLPNREMDAVTLRLLRQFADQDLSYVDALSLHLVQVRGDIEAIFAFDHHLALVKIPVLPGPLG